MEYEQRACEEPYGPSRYTGMSVVMTPESLSRSFLVKPRRELHDFGRLSSPECTRIRKIASSRSFGIFAIEKGCVSCGEDDTLGLDKKLASTSKQHHSIVLLTNAVPLST